MNYYKGTPNKVDDFHKGDFNALKMAQVFNRTHKTQLEFYRAFLHNMRSK